MREEVTAHRLAAYSDAIKLQGRAVESAKGLFIRDHRGLHTVGYSGGSGGYHSFLLRFPEQHFSVACLCNGGVRASKRAYKVAEVYLERLMKPKQSASDVSTHPEQLQLLLGTYRDPNKREVCRITMEEKRLRADFGEGPVELRPLSPTEFEPVDYPWRMRLAFGPLHKGVSRKLLVSREEYLFDFPRMFEAIKETNPAVAELSAYADYYWSDELRVSYNIAIKEGQLWLKELIGADGIVHGGTIRSKSSAPCWPMNLI